VAAGGSMGWEAKRLDLIEIFYRNASFLCREL
jgi:hypothetical protein